MNPRMAKGLAMANCSPRHRSGFEFGSHRTYMVLAMKYGSHVTTKHPVVSMTTLMAFHLVGCFPVFRPSIVLGERFLQHRKHLVGLRFSSDSGCSAAAGALAAAAAAVPPPPRNNRKLPARAPCCSRLAFFSCATRRRALCRMMLYRTMTTIRGIIPTTVVSIMRAGGAKRTNQHTRPPSVSPRQPNAGRKPMIRPVEQSKSLGWFLDYRASFMGGLFSKRSLGLVNVFNKISYFYKS